MINDFNKNSSLLTATAVMFLMQFTGYSNSTVPTNLQYVENYEQSTTSLLNNKVLIGKGTFGDSSEYFINKEGGYMMNPTTKVGINHRQDNILYDLDYYQNINDESLSCESNTIMKVKSKISSIAKAKNSFVDFEYCQSINEESLYTEPRKTIKLKNKISYKNM